MSWPYDALLKTFSALVQVPSSVLNNMQTQINNIAGGVGGTHEIPMVNGFVGTSGGWELNAINFRFGWQRQASGGRLIIPIPCRQGARLTQVELKVEDTSGGAWSFTLEAADKNWATSASAPTTALLIENVTAPIGVGWFTRVFDSVSSGGNLPYVVGADEDIFLSLTAPASGDHVAGMRAQFDQFY